MSLYRPNDRRPRPPAGGNYWIAPSATVVGDVTPGPEVDIWSGAVLRGDNEPILVGARTNIQEHAMIHADPGFPASNRQANYVANWRRFATGLAEI